MRVVEEDLEGLSGLGAHCMADVLRCGALVRAASDGVGTAVLRGGCSREGGDEGSLRGAKCQRAWEACPMLVCSTCCNFSCYQVSP